MSESERGDVEELEQQVAGAELREGEDRDVADEDPPYPLPDDAHAEEPSLGAVNGVDEDESAREAPSPMDEDQAVAAEGEGDREDLGAEPGLADQEGDDQAAGKLDPRWNDEAAEPMLKRALESLVFVSDKIITHVQLARHVRARPAQVKQLLAELVEDTESRGVQLVEVSGGYQFRSAPQCGEFVRNMVAQKPVRLTRAQLETLALVAYRQPITRPEIDDVRGVDTGSAIKVLLERGLVKMLGRKDEAGRPMLYGTTAFFLEFFGLKALRDLPTLREFTELSDDSRALFKRKTGETVEQAQADLEIQDVETPLAADDGLSPEGEAEEDAMEQGDVAEPYAADSAVEAAVDSDFLEGSVEARASDLEPDEESGLRVDALEPTAEDEDPAEASTGEPAALDGDDPAGPGQDGRDSGRELGEDWQERP